MATEAAADLASIAVFNWPTYIMSTWRGASSKCYFAHSILVGTCPHRTYPDDNYKNVTCDEYSTTTDRHEPNHPTANTPAIHQTVTIDFIDIQLQQYISGLQSLFDAKDWRGRIANF